MTEIEVPLEKVHEDMHHALHGEANRMMLFGALLSCILAVFAAISALMDGHYANESMLMQIKSSDQWSFYQAKGIKSAITELKISLAQRDPKPDEKIIQSLNEKFEGYKKDQEEIKEKAQEKEQEGQMLLHKHEKLATAVTFFQVAIAMTAIAVLAKRNQFMYVSGVLGLIGLVFLCLGFGNM